MLRPQVVGSGEQLGEWQAQQGLQLTWGEGHVWTANVELVPGTYEFKCITATGEAVVEWEPGSNRILQVRRNDSCGSTMLAG